MNRAVELSIVIVNWNSKAFLRRCLASVGSHPGGLRCEVIVIDSGSFDGCGEMLAAEHPGVRFIQSPSNIGFARANNAAFRASVGECVLFLNPDTEVVGPAIEVLFQRLQALPDAGVVGCRLLNTDGSVQDTCIQAFPTLLGQFLNSRVLRSAYPRWPMWGKAALLDALDRPAPVEVVSGACFMVRRRVFEQIGMFSEAYFMYAEDLDLCHKSRSRGYTNYFVPDAVVVHHGGGSSEQAGSEFSVVMMRDSIWRFLTATRGRFYGAAYRLSTLLLALARLALLLCLRPLQPLRQGESRWRASFRKWRAVLGWSFGRRPPTATPP
jgi:N-acetylglucosaminyl-diphospho-decaprenol L-rhamnosyltransferase